MPWSQSDSRRLVEKHQDRDIAVFLLQVLPGWIVKFIGLNDQYVKEVGLPNAFVAGKTPHEAFPPDKFPGTADSICEHYTLCAKGATTIKYREHLQMLGPDPEPGWDGWDWWDTALYPIVQKGVVVAIVGETRRASSSVTTQKEFAAALERSMSGASDEVFLDYQPIFNAKTLEIVGFEALLRWPAFNKGGPEVFLGVAREAGMSPLVNQFVLRAVAKALAKLDQRLWISVNVEVLEIEKLLKVLVDHHGISEKRLALEILEQAKITDGFKQELSRIRLAGHSIKQDDYGEKESGLRRLRDIEPDTLKIDKSFVREVDQDFQNQAFCESTMVLAEKLGVEVVAEGVETDEELLWCQEHNVTYLQGYNPRLGKPGPLPKDFLKE